MCKPNIVPSKILVGEIGEMSEGLVSPYRKRYGCAYGCLIIMQ